MTSPLRAAARGRGPKDLEAFLRKTWERPLALVEILRCGCQQASFELVYEPDEGVARRTCLACKRAAYVADSESFWREAQLDGQLLTWQCGCAGKKAELAQGREQEADGRDTWIVLATRCIACGSMSIPVDWGLVD